MGLRDADRRVALPDVRHSVARVSAGPPRFGGLRQQAVLVEAVALEPTSRALTVAAAFKALPVVRGHTKA